MTGWHKFIVRGVYKLPSVRAPMFKTTLNNRLMNLTCLDWFWVKSLGIPIILLRTKYILQKLLRPVHKAENFFSHSTNQAIKEIKVYVFTTSFTINLVYESYCSRLSGHKVWKTLYREQNRMNYTFCP